MGATENIRTELRECLKSALTTVDYVAPIVASMSMQTLHAKPSTPPDVPCLAGICRPCPR